MDFLKRVSHILINLFYWIYYYRYYNIKQITLKGIVSCLGLFLCLNPDHIIWNNISHCAGVESVKFSDSSIPC